jgi:hypothetical protein
MPNRRHACRPVGAHCLLDGGKHGWCRARMCVQEAIMSLDATAETREESWAKRPQVEVCVGNKRDTASPSINGMSKVNREGYVRT